MKFNELNVKYWMENLINSNEIKILIAKLLANIPTKSGVPLDKTDLSLLNERSFDSAHILLLEKCNGLYCFSMGLRIFGLTEKNDWKYDLRAWNANNLWKQSFSKNITLGYFFADTVFGDQFSYNENSEIVKTNAETGFSKVVSESFSDWVAVLLDDPNEMIDLDLLLDWYDMGGGQLEVGNQIKPLIPFSLGGCLESRNSAVLRDARKHMLWNGLLASQLIDLSPGDKIDLEAINIPENVYIL